MNILRHFALLLALALPLAEASGLRFVETADGQRQTKARNLIQWTHSRLVFDKALERVAVGQDSTLELEVLSATEVLALAKSVGRTSVMVWYADNSTETFVFSVVQDLSVLRRALADVHRGIRIELAPDRAALVLRGRVPTVQYRQAAESVAQNYLDAGRAPKGGPADILVQGGAMGQGVPDNRLRVTSASTAPSGYGSAAVINLIQVDELPLSREDKIRKAIADIGGDRVRIRRIQSGDLPDDQLDTLVLSGRVANQVVLTRILNLATRLYLNVDPSGNAELSVRALADESGALLGKRGSSASGGGGFAGLATASSELRNDIQANIARAKLISAAGGRILSLIDVDDLPQVRVAVQMHEVDRQRLKAWRPDLRAISSGYSQAGSYPISGLQQRPNEANAVEAALQLVGGVVSSNLQLTAGSYAFDLLFSMLEEAGVSRTLSRPTLTVLAGESAVFRAGGEVPVPSAFAPNRSQDDLPDGVFSSTQFKAFGVELRVRAMVDENDRITLDIQPTVSLPDTQLTLQIANSTGSSLNSSAFDVRSINTSAHLEDGEPLVIGGLVSRDFSHTDAQTPGLSDVPLVGKLAESNRRTDTDRELIIVVIPTLVRPLRHDLALWHYPDPRELLQAGLQQPRTRLHSHSSTATELQP